MKLTAAQALEIDTSGTPTAVQDESGKTLYYLLGREQFEKIKLLLNGVESIDPSLYEFRDVER